MADLTIGELQAVAVGDLPLAPDIYDDDLLVMEQNGEAVSVSVGLLKSTLVSAVLAELAAEEASS